MPRLTMHPDVSATYLTLGFPIMAFPTTILPCLAKDRNCILGDFEKTAETRLRICYQVAIAIHV